MDENTKSTGASDAASTLGAILILANSGALIFGIFIFCASRVGEDGGYDPLGVVIVSVLGIPVLLGLSLAAGIYLLAATSMHIGFRIAVFVLSLAALGLAGVAFLF